MDEFDRCLARVLVNEGGFSNNPKDPGGATMKGVTQRVYNGYRTRNNLPNQTVQSITDTELKAIYKEQYWDACKCDMAPVGISYCLFDGAVNSGPSQSIKWLQRALGVTVDGQMGPGTLAAVNEAEPIGVIDSMEDRRLIFMKALKGWSTFGRGWEARVQQVRDTAKAWSNAVDARPASFADLGNAKASVLDAKKPTSTALGDTTSGAGGITVVLTQLQDQLAPYTSMQLVGQVVVWLTLAGAVAVAGGYAYRLWAKRRTDALNDALDTKVILGAAA